HGARDPALPAQDPRRPRSVDAGSFGPTAWKGCVMGGEQKVAAAPEPAELTLRRLVHFTEVLRHNAFTIGLKESEDAARVLASEAAGRPATLRAALKSLLCARRSD